MKPSGNHAHAYVTLLATDTCGKLQMHERASSTPMSNERKQTTMIEYLKTWLELKTDRRAVTALEYGVIAGVMAVVLVTAFTTLGNKLTGVFNTIGNEL
jgi:pilus assembly protein Flp/PilA